MIRFKKIYCLAILLIFFMSHSEAINKTQEIETKNEEIPLEDTDIIYLSNIKPNKRNYNIEKQKTNSLYTFYEFFFARIKGEYEKRTNGKDTFSLHGNMTVTGIGLLRGERYDIFGFYKIHSTYLIIDDFFGRCKDGKINGMGFNIIDYS